MRKKIKLIILLSIISMLIISCSQQKPKSKPKKSKIPSKFTSVVLNTNQTINDLEEFYLKRKKETQKKKQKKEKQKKKKQKEKNKKQNPSKKEKTWNKIEKKIKKIHQDWNSYETESKLDGKKLNKIEQKLNDLTEVATQKKILISLWKANQFHLNLAKLYNKYDAKIGIKKKIIAYTRKIVYLTWLDESKNKKLADINKLKNLVSDLKVKIKTKNKKKIKEVNKAVKDLEIAVKQDTTKVIKIKSDLIKTKIKNLKT
ncbi:hypothetical protein [Sporohalobacter salinus]|uniref:hypothetical protein n=1 Tax=Sporohalobacter salinus TaxID=1494606 RepID=UPI001961272F|nr:hypothetical protein [Sporohalobacter salinus]MBM7622822.1 hypothetical protein [Sporohalobacter salinus]